MAANTIHATAVIAPTVRMGRGNIIGPFTFMTGNVTIGDNNWVGPHVTIGTPAQYTTSKFELSGEAHSGITIGNRCVIREYSTVHQPSKFSTVMEDDCYLMAYCHVSHDTVLRRGVAMANNTQIGGFSEIQAYATLGLSSVIHQYSTVGAFAMIGMGTVITKDVPPFVKVVGTPARLTGVNEVGLARNGFTQNTIAAIVAAYTRGLLPALDDPLASEHMIAFEQRREERRRPLIVLRNALS
ncbi:MAG: UDP-N-acetylglucosamine acyltransferase [Candidatus Eremiobacteraeota bacterium]|nr:UDP-N-acetylglucosamine acyltransferase [Candidatus Eremiobacteraeota bacterium]